MDELLNYKKSLSELVMSGIDDSNKDLGYARKEYALLLMFCDGLEIGAREAAKLITEKLAKAKR